MELTTKPDVETCLDRVEAWWDGGIIDRPPVTIHVRSGRMPRKIPAAHACLRDRWLDVEYAVESAEANIEAGVFVAENFPKYVPNIGPEVCAAAYGAQIQFGENTSWSVPCVDHIRDVLAMQPNLEAPYWQTIRRMTALSLERGAGRWITTVADLHTNGDLLAALRDPQNLALDYADDFEGVRLACRHVAEHFGVLFGDLYGPIAAAGLPCSTWGSMIARGSAYYVSCDFICMISPAMFADTILPAIAWETAYLDRSIFHLDGPGALKHLDALLGLKDLNAIQWTYGAGSGRAGDWIDVYRRVQDAGKGVEVQAIDLDDARAIMDHLKPEGVWLCVGGSYTMDEAQAILAEVERWAAGKR